MGETVSSTVRITNTTDGHAWIVLYHRNSTNGIQSGAWFAGPGETVGPLTVFFQLDDDVPDEWAVVLSVQDGSAPGLYVNAGSLTSAVWKECMLEQADAGQTFTSTVSATSYATNQPSGSCSCNMVRQPGPPGPITNVFVLMLENHSFDSVFAMSGIPGIIAATSDDANSHDGATYTVQSPAPVVMPSDPGHEFPDVLQQLTLATSYVPGSKYPPITRAGFVANYATTTSEGPVPPAMDVGQIMHCFATASQLPVIHQLATEFAICDQWFSSLPGPTWPNRFFVHGGSSNGLDHSPTSEEIAAWEATGLFEFRNGSIYDALTRAGIRWRLYNDTQGEGQPRSAYSDDPQSGSDFGGVPQVSAVHGIHLLDDINSLRHFAADLQSPYPYRYTFIEPNYGDVSGDYAGGSSQHPQDDVYGGESLIKAVYEAIRSSPLWSTSLLIVTYDEHGGFYDSASPGPAPAPADGSPSTHGKYGFDFTQYGVRVPAVVVSPRIPRGTVDHTVYDHASVLATVERVLGLGHLTQRDRLASDVLPLLKLPSPRTDCPIRLVAPNPPVPRRAKTAQEVATADAQPLSKRGNLRAFLGMALKLQQQLSPGDAEQIRERFRGLKTVGEAREFLAATMRQVAAARGKRLQAPS